VTATTIIGYIAAFLGTVAWIPQVWKTWTSRETKDLSLWANLLMLTNLCLWLAYGVLLAAWPLIVANFIGIVFVGSIVIAKLIYK
jgi:MtN3 and saliva related transmembrane protein